MAGDPNARRDKALESIARELAETNRHLKVLADNSKKRVQVTNHIVQPSPPDPFVPTGEEAQPAPEPESGFPQSTHPYFKRSNS